MGDIGTVDPPRRLGPRFAWSSRLVGVVASRLGRGGSSSVSVTGRQPPCTERTAAGGVTLQNGAQARRAGELGRIDIFEGCAIVTAADAERAPHARSSNHEPVRSRHLRRVQRVSFNRDGWDRWFPDHATIVEVRKLLLPCTDPGVGFGIGIPIRLVGCSVFGV